MFPHVCDGHTFAALVRFGHFVTSDNRAGIQQVAHNVPQRAGPFAVDDPDVRQTRAVSVVEIAIKHRFHFDRPLSTKIDEVGHTGTQAPQSMHVAGST